MPVAGLAEALGGALVAAQDGEIVGSVAIELYGNAALLRSLAVASRIRGRGLGERLAAEALRMARDRGAVDVFLLTETASGFFPRFGFVPRDRKTAPAELQRSVEFRSACPEGAVMMHTRVTP